jgi:hypothetical protein
MNKLKLGSILIRRGKTTATDNVKNPSSNRKYRLLFASSSISLAGFYFYYQSYLNDQEKRRVRVNIKSLFRAIRFV